MAQVNLKLVFKAQTPGAGMENPKRAAQPDPCDPSVAEKLRWAMTADICKSHSVSEEKQLEAKLRGMEMEELQANAKKAARSTYEYY